MKRRSSYTRLVKGRADLGTSRLAHKSDLEDMEAVKQAYDEFGPNYGPASLQVQLTKKGYKISR